MSHIRSYQLVEETTFIGFALAVNRLLEAGWELHGPTQVSQQQIDYHEFITYYHQAMALLKTPILEPQPDRDC